jgi:hypothetical protein
VILIAALPFAIAVLLRLFFGPAQARRLPPAPATWLITALAVSVAVCCGLVLSAAAVLAIAQLPQIARIGQWSVPVLVRDGSPPSYLGYAAFAGVVLLLGLAARRSWLAVHAELRARTMVNGLATSDAQLIVVDDTTPTAYAVGSARGRIVVSTALLQALGAPERRVVLAHEAAHLRHRHGLFVHLCELAAAANPLLRRLPATVRAGVERWADESAADEVGDRRLTATAVARAALLRSRHRADRGVLAVADGDVSDRVQALLAPPVAGHWPARLLLAVGCAVCWASAALVVLRTHDLIEAAERLVAR